MGSTSDIQLEQVLHGYGDGHQLLAASIPLPRRCRTQMLVMSDLSGSSIRPGFESYLTAYPLEENAGYALARTWYADEMPRPGCVWTHTLILRTGDISRVPQMSLVLPLFRRPYGAATEEYTQPVALSAVGDGDTESSPIPQGVPPENLIAPILCSDAPVVAACGSSDEYEASILSLWSLFWPELRATFRLCTGSLGVRAQPFDIQCVPYDVERHFRRSTPSFVLVGHGQQAPNEGLEPWLQAVADAMVTRRGGLRDFLWRFGPGCSAERATVRWLSEAYVCDQEVRAGVRRAGALLDLIARAFPRRGDASLLKETLFGPGRDGRKGASSEEAETLRLLCVDPAGEALDPTALAVEARARNLYQDAPDIALTVADDIAAHSATECGQRFLTGVAAAVSTSSVPANASPSLLFALVRRDPAMLAAMRPAAGRAFDVSPFLMFTRDHTEQDDALRRSVIELGVEGGFGSAATVVNVFGREAIDIALDAISIGSGGIRIAPELATCIERFSDRLVERFRAKSENSRIAWLAAAILSPSALGYADREPQRWSAVCTSPSRLEDMSLQTRAACFLLAIAFDSPRGAFAGELAALCHPIAYQAGWDKVISDGTWELLWDRLPGYKRDWDRCSRMARGFAENAIDGSWSTECFLRGLVAEQSFSVAVSCAQSMWRGRRFLGRVCNDVHMPGVEVPSALAQDVLTLCDGREDNDY